MRTTSAVSQKQACILQYFLFCFFAIVKSEAHGRALRARRVAELRQRFVLPESFTKHAHSCRQVATRSARRSDPTSASRQPLATKQNLNMAGSGWECWEFWEYWERLGCAPLELPRNTAFPVLPAAPSAPRIPSRIVRAIVNVVKLSAPIVKCRHHAIRHAPSPSQSSPLAFVALLLCVRKKTRPPHPKSIPHSLFPIPQSSHSPFFHDNLRERILGGASRRPTGWH